MRLQDLAESLHLRELTPEGAGRSTESDVDITEGYASDLLSDVLAHAPAGGILVTLQIQPGIVTVAGMAGLRAVVFTCGRVPEGEAIQKATEEGLPLYVTALDTFEAIGRLYSLGIRGGTNTGGDGRTRGARVQAAREEFARALPHRRRSEEPGLAPVWVQADTHMPPSSGR
jgi:hypothetical protein